MFHRATPSFSFSILASRSPRRSSSPIRARTLVHCLAEPRMSWSLRQSFSQSFLMISTARVILGCTLSFLKRTFLVLCSPPATTWSQWNAIWGQDARRHRCQEMPCQQKVTWRYSATAPLCWPLSFLADWSPTCNSIILILTWQTKFTLSGLL